MKQLIRLYLGKRMALIIAGMFMVNWSFGADGSLFDHLGVSRNVLYYSLLGLAVFQVIGIIVLADTIKNLLTNTNVWKSKWKNSLKTLLLCFAMSTVSALQAQTHQGETDVLSVAGDGDLWLMILLNGVLFLFYLGLFALIKSLLAELKTKEKVKVAKAPSVVIEWTKKLTDAVPIEEEHDVLLDHNYDGIQELDNNLPPWWKFMFYISIVFSFIYLVHFHLLKTGPSSSEEYKMAMEEAETAVAEYLKNSAANVDEFTVTQLTDKSRIANGASIYEMSCKACHGKYGEGGTGPNFTDKYWLHGGSIQDVFKTIKYGVLEKGMISWKSQLSPVQIQDVASFILTLQGTNPPDAKEPQGDLYEPQISEKQ